MTFTTEQLLLERTQKIHTIKYVTGKMKILFELKGISFVFNSFYPISVPSENMRKPKIFWRFSGGKEMVNLAKMGYINT